MRRRWPDGRRWCSLGWALDAERRRLPKPGTAPVAFRPPSGVWLSSFRFATLGLLRVWRSERNFRVQAAAGWLAVTLAWIVGMSAVGTAVLLVMIASVLAAETLNTAVETAVDLVSEGPHPLAGAAKDLAAGGVLCVSLGTVGAGIALFWPWLRHPARLAAAIGGHPLAAVAGLIGLVFLVTAAAAPLSGRRSA